MCVVVVLHSSAAICPVHVVCTVEHRWTAVLPIPGVSLEVVHLFGHQLGIAVFVLPTHHLVPHFRLFDRRLTTAGRFQEVVLVVINQPLHRTHYRASRHALELRVSVSVVRLDYRTDDRTSV